MELIKASKLIGVTFGQIVLNNWNNLPQGNINRYN